MQFNANETYLFHASHWYCLKELQFLDLERMTQELMKK